MKLTKPKSPVMIPTTNIVPFDGHPYKVLDDDSMNDLVMSIQESGILEPLIVHPLENSEGLYEIISGHRRYRAAQKAGMSEIPAFIRAVSRDEAAIMLVDSNLHRERILPSEKAFSYKLKYDALSHQGTSRQVGAKLRTSEEMAENTSDSARQIQRYIRLTNLIPELLDMMDIEKIAFSVGVELSFLSDELQYDVLNACEENENTPSYAQAVRMHKAYNAGELDCESIYDIMCQLKANQRETVKISAERIRSVIPQGYTAKQQEDYIIKALEHYRHYLYLQRQRDSR